MKSDSAVPWSEVFEKEREVLDARCPGQAQNPDACLTGLALSGGGVRSGAFSLGVLQVLAGAGLLKHFDYLSTVSGGGYIGSALTLRLAQAADKGEGDDPDALFPYGRVAEDGQAEDSAELEHFRHHASYLAPSGFGSLATGFFIVARSILLNLFIWITLGAAALAMLMAVAEWTAKGWRPLLLKCLYSRDGMGIYAPGAGSPPLMLFEALLWVAAGLVALLAAAVVGVSLSSWWVRSDRSTSSRGLWIVALIAVILSLAAVDLLPFLHGRDKGDWPPVASDFVQATWPVMALLAILIPVATIGLRACGDGRKVSMKYARRRLQESLAGRMMIAALVLAVFGAIPAVSNYLIGQDVCIATAEAQAPGQQALPAPQQASPAQEAKDVDAAKQKQSIPLHLFLLYLFSGASALYGFYRAHIQSRLGPASAVVIIAGSILLIFGSTLIAHQIAERLWQAGWPGGWLYRENAVALTWETSAGPAMAVLAALALALFVNVNDMSLSRFYRDRLMEAFMPDVVKDKPKSGPASEADKYRMSQVAAEPAKPGTPEKPLIGPYPLINAYLLARRYRSDRAAPNRQDLATRVQRRRGDSFILSPRYVGSSLTGWKKTPDVLDNQLTVATAMAISGAAINPGGGLAGRGVTVNTATAAAMALLSLRLGYRFRWNGKSRFGRLRRWLNPFGNHIAPGATEVIAELAQWPTGENPAFIELSDGGHFDNLGLYELVRRRCGLIVICDGGEDPAGSYEAFTSVMTMIREDFGAVIRFDREMDGAQSSPAQLVARPRQDQYPSSAEFAQKGYFIATIHYERHEGLIEDRAKGAPFVGLVIYMKAAMLDVLDLPARGYKGAHPDFPFEPTTDQFFSPEQFAAYRDVGNRVALQMLAQTGLAKLLGQNGCRRPVLATLLTRFPKWDPAAAPARSP